MIFNKMHQKLHVSWALFMSLGGKPEVIKVWLVTARKAQLAALVIVLFLAFLAPTLSATLADTLYPPPAQSLGKRIVKVFAPGVSHKHPLRDLRYQQFHRHSFWLLLLPIGLLLSHLPTALHQCQGKAEQLKLQARTETDTNAKARLLTQADNLSVAVELFSATPKLAHLGKSQATLLRSTGAQDSQNTTLMYDQDAHSPYPTVGTNGRYQLIKALASGGAGVVYQALDTRLKRQVAIKQLLSHNARDGAMVARFQEEAHALANLNHPNIIPIYDLLDEQGQVWMVMELMTGGTLANKIHQQGSFALGEALTLLGSIMEGLAAAHAKHIVHRDIKPENILFNASGIAKIGDFGIAKSAANITKTQLGLVLGSPGYMSPEQAAGQSTDHRSDIYALGITLFEMLSGSLPFTGSTTQVLSKHITQQAPKLSELLPNIDPSVDALLQKMLAKEPEQRYQNLLELQLAMNAISVKLTTV